MNTEHLGSTSKKLQKEWSAWNTGLERSNLSDILNNLQSFDVKTQLKLITAALNFDDDNNESIQRELSEIEGMNCGEWNVWVPIIAECVNRRLFEGEPNSKPMKLDKYSKEIAEILLSNSWQTDKNENSETLCQADLARRYFFTESAEAATRIGNKQQHRSCTYSKDEPDFLSREIAIEEKKQSQNIAPTSSSGFSFK